MGWLEDYKQDVSKYVGPGGGSAWKPILGEQGLWALLEYRVASSVYHSSLPRAVKLPLRLVLTVWHKLIEILTGMNLPCTAQIGSGLHLPHCGARIIHAAAVIGRDCCISQGVTIGISGRGEQRGVPVIGDRVYIGANAVVVGKVQVGDEAVIAANSLVIRDVAPRCGVIGVPARVVDTEGSADYIVMPKPNKRVANNEGAMAQV